MKRLFGLAACGLLTIAAAGKDTSSPNPLVGALVRCKAVGNETERLRCYDGAVTNLVDATSKGSVMVVDREDVRETRRTLFGFSLPKAPLFRGDNSHEDEPQEIEAKIQSVRSLGNDKWMVVLDNGARWQTTEPTGMQQEPKPGDKISIKRGLMGGYFLKVETRRALRGMRLG